MLLYLTLLSALGSGCAPALLEVERPPAQLGADRVLVIWNRNAPESKRIVDAYKKARNVPESNILSVSTTTEMDIPRVSYNFDLRDAVRDAIQERKLKIDYLLLIRGVPIRINDVGQYSVDASLMVDAHPSRKTKPLAPMPPDKITEADVNKIISPYFREKKHFSSDEYGLYLATRLDGYTVEDTLGLIERSLNAKAEKGEFLLDSHPDKGGGGYGETQAHMVPAKETLLKRGYSVTYDTSKAFVGSQSPLMGYASWGSNDNNFSQSVYNSLKFKAGALCETYVSTSGRSFRRITGGQSLVADLISQGVTGVKGYVSEPYTLALAWVDILFDRYTDGFNLAESFYAASPLLKWKDVVIGDPLCNPYKKN